MWHRTEATTCVTTDTATQTWRSRYSKQQIYTKRQPRQILTRGAKSVQSKKRCRQRKEQIHQRRHDEPDTLYNRCTQADKYGEADSWSNTTWYLLARLINGKFSIHRGRHDEADTLNKRRPRQINPRSDVDKPDNRCNNTDMTKRIL